MTRFSNRMLSSRLGAHFEVLEPKSHSEIQVRNGEFFDYVPMVRKANYPATRDPNKPGKTVYGTFTWESALQRIGMRETEVVTRTPRLYLHRTEACITPSRADVFRRHKDGTQFEVTSVEKDGLSGLMINLVQLGVPS